MTLTLSVLLLVVLAALVFSAGWRMVPPAHGVLGGCVASLLFLIHPSVFPGFKNVSLWGPLFVILFLCAWLWMENWSLFMRSWVLAGVYAFGLWVGSSFVLWGLVAMVPWVLFNRRPLAAVGSLATVLIGGVVIFSVTWGVAYLTLPAIDLPLFRQWIHWSGFGLPPPHSLPWFLLWAMVVIPCLRDMINKKRSDAITYASSLLLVTVFLRSAESQLALAAVAAPLIARLIVKKEFLYHRRVRWVVSLTFVAVLLVAYVLQGGGWQVTGLAMILMAAVATGHQRFSGSPRFMVGEAVCVGAYLAEALGSFLHLFPRF